MAVELTYKIDNLLLWNLNDESEFVEFKNSIQYKYIIPYSMNYKFLNCLDIQHINDDYISSNNAVSPIYYYTTDTNEVISCEGYYLKDIYYDTVIKECFAADKTSHLNYKVSDNNGYSHLEKIRGIITIFKENEYDYKLLEYIGGCKWQELKLLKYNPILNDVNDCFVDGVVKPDCEYTWPTDILKTYYNTFYDSDKENPVTPIYEQASVISVGTNTFDVDNKGQILDYRESYDNPIYLKHNNNNVTLCETIYLYDDVEYNYGIWPYHGTWNYTKNTYVLVEKTKKENGDYAYYPLYSPELLTEFGIGFIVSDWLSYDTNGELIIEWWPDRCGTAFWDSNGVKQTNLSDDLLNKYSQNNPFIGTVKSMRTVISYINMKNTPIFEDDDPTTKQINVDWNIQTGTSLSLGTPHLSLSECIISDSVQGRNVPGKLNRFIKKYDPSENKTNEFLTLDAEVRLTHTISKTNVVKQEKYIYFEYNNVVWDSVNKCYLYNPGERIHNIAVFDDYILDNGEVYPYQALYLLDDYKNYYVNSYNKYGKNSPTDTLGTVVLKNITNKTLFEGNTLFKYERWVEHRIQQNDIINTDIYQQITGNVGWYGNSQQKYNYSGIKFLKTEKYIASETEESAETLLDEMEEQGIWKTPYEYYSEDSISSEIVDYVHSETSKNVINYKKWFWIDEIANWGTWKNPNKREVELFVWNGKNGWDSLDDILKCWKLNDWQMLKIRYLYDRDVFTLGPSYNTWEGFGIKFKDNARLSYNTLVLNRDNKFSTYNSDTFQNVRSSDVKLCNDRFIVEPGINTQTGEKTGNLILAYNSNVFSETGCPCIVRSNGQLLLLNKMMYDGNYDENTLQFNKNMLKDEILKLNDMCIAFFGEGNDKTIKKDWKRFNTVNSEEEITTIITTEEIETIYNKPSQINSVADADTINMNMTITVPRPNVVTRSTNNPDYALRWDR